MRREYWNVPVVEIVALGQDCPLYRPISGQKDAHGQAHPAARRDGSCSPAFWRISALAE